MFLLYTVKPFKVIILICVRGQLCLQHIDKQFTKEELKKKAKEHKKSKNHPIVHGGSRCWYHQAVVERICVVDEFQAWNEVVDGKNGENRSSGIV